MANIEWFGLTFIAGIIGMIIGFFIGISMRNVVEKPDLAPPKEEKKSLPKASKGKVFCPRCGRETDETGMFCQWCGANIK